MFSGLLVAIVLACGASAAASFPGLARSDMSKRMIIDETGCVCQGIFMGAGTSAFSYQLLYPGYPEGWCWQDGKMTTASIKRIQEGIDLNAETHYVNGTWVIETCRVQSVPLAKCAAYIAQLTTVLWDASSLVTCDYPVANYRPTTCSCGWECNPGFFKCGNRCIDHARQMCQLVSAVPIPRALSPLRCSQGESLCRIPLRNGGKDKGYECIDTSSNLESCGGCPDDSSAVDCSVIPHASSASCVNGACVVSSCQRGYKLANNECVRK